MEDLFFDVLIVDVVVGLFLKNVVFVFEDLDLGFDFLYFFLIVLGAFFALADEVVCKVVVLHWDTSEINYWRVNKIV